MVESLSTARIPDGTPLGLVQAGRGPTHGQRSTYVAGCRCTDCTDANSDFQTARQRLGRVSPGGSHGLSGYNAYGCRCQVCRLAKSESNARRYAESVRAKALADEIAVRTADAAPQDQL